MEEFDVLKNLPRVAAPPDFEQRVMDRLREKKKALAARPPLRARLWLAAVPAALIAAFFTVNVLVLNRPVSLSRSWDAPQTESVSSKTSAGSEAVAVMEPLDYRQDFHRLSEDRGTVYILESISDEVHRDIIY